MNTIHMNENDWAMYLQTYTPTNEEEAQQYANDLKAYANDNAGCIMVEAILRRPELQGFDPLNKLYASVKRDLIGHQQAIKEGFYIK